MPYVNGLVTATAFDTKLKEVESKMPEVSGLVKKVDYDARETYLMQR